MNNIDNEHQIHYYDFFKKIVNIKKMIDDGYFFCFNTDFFEKMNNIMYIKPANYAPYIDSVPSNIVNSYGAVFIDDTIDDYYIKIFLGKDKPNSIHKGWSESVPIDKVDKLLKLKCFI